MLHLILPNSYQLSENEIGIFNALIPTIISSIIRLAPFSPDNVIVSEKERIMLARQLHDTVGQNLGFLLLKLEEFKSIQALSAQSERTVDEMRLIADQAYEQIRDTLTTLKPIKIQELAPTLYQVAMAIASHQPALAVQMSQDGQPFDIPIDKMQHIIDICREAFTNVVKHAQATKIEIKIYWQIDMLTISIKDNGLGIHTKTKELESFGMQMMFERASEIDGKIQLNSQPAKGLEVLLQLLLP
jgi:nitrate/nitrite-specific signal transduction histidine kinase